MTTKVMLIEAAGSWLAHRQDMKDLEQVVLPHGLMQVSAASKERLGHRVEVRVRHAFADYDSDEDISRELESFGPDVIGLRGLHVYRNRFCELAELTKRTCPKALLVAGGPYVTASALQAMSCGIDVGVLGEGDETFPLLLENLIQGKGFEDMAGIAYKTGTGDVVVNRARPFVRDMDALPLPDYDSIDLGSYERYMTYGYNRRRQGVVMSSRGCPYKCAYCHNMFGRTFRARSAESVVVEMLALHRERGIKDFYFIDDGFNLDRGRVERFCSMVTDSGVDFNLYFANGLRADLLDPELVDMLVDAGTIWVTYALETASPRLQKLIRKNLDLNKLDEIARYSVSKGIMVNICFMVGLPTETKQEALSTIEFVKNIPGLVLPMFFGVKYYPNTDIYRMGIENGLNLPQADKAFDLPYHDVTGSGTPTLPASDMREVYFKFLKEVFLQRKRLEQAIEIQRQHYTDKEIKDSYSLLLRRRISDLERDLLQYAV